MYQELAQSPGNYKIACSRRREGLAIYFQIRASAYPSTFL
ncbi:hypothetical protein ECTHROOPD_0906 [Escherichia coli ThroopD]|nr:hypothetical protein ECBCE034MS14_3177 [Escherichia coli BCE034_MS-14]EMX00749.1 hypothetical protein ECTHROOPD_0906 [Escherichia coli ThroopD]EMX92704.1 hypothetical protein EC2720900_2536 [Escherichia coli 2720900]EMZ73755.1 hypothetical protein EC2722950_4701 [Escherichia coli 2722950]ENB17877.1 hypothetical protein ECBCE011MS01_4608 [Escherichia coli BCE011_MS-01]KDT31879.1 hypothetical protein AC04_4838 [Escherichia coli 3-105-05_S3_C1]KDT42577.1 hypothetical protein AC32_4885 [Escher